MQSEQKPSKLESRYQFHSLIGRGGAGEVFAAWDDHLKRTVAIKRIKPNGLDDDTLSNPWSEAIRLAAIRHANIVTVYDMGHDNEVPYIVMEHVQGETIDERVISQGIFALPDFLDMARQTLEGLLAAHHAGLIHRDLKPSNIMLSPLPSVNFRVKILDFGMAKFLSTPSAQTMCIDGSIIGSISWISPEQLNHKAVDARSDLYSLGCVFYYALTGKEPFPGSNTMEVMAAHFSHNVVPLETLRPELPLVLAQWVMALINLEPDDRYQSAMQALNALNAIAAYTGSLPQPVNPTTTIITPAVAAPGLDPSTGGMSVQLVQQGTGQNSAPVNGNSEPTVTAISSGSPVPAPPLAESRTVSTPPAQEQPRRQMVGIWNGVFALVLLILVGAVAYLFGRVHPANHTSQAAETAAGSKAAAEALVPSAYPNEQRRLTQPPLQETASASGAVALPAPPVPPAPVAANTPGSPAPAPELTPVVPPVSAPVAEVVLRVHGSNTIGAKLLPALMMEFLKSEGGTEIRRKAGSGPEDVRIEAMMGNGNKAVEIQAHGSTTAFQGLLSGECELGMASRSIKSEELGAIAAAGLGDLHSSTFEHVLGLDGIAMLVNKDNPVSSLTKQQLAAIFSGQISDWQNLGGSPGPIHLYARDSNSGTFDTFKSLVLEKLDLASSAKRFEDSNELSDAVASDPAGIGFVGLPFVGEAKALAVSEVGTSPFIASRFTVATEDYLLSRRLFLYTTSASRGNPLVKKFIAFALSDEGQAVVHAQGFVKQTIDLQHLAPPQGAPAEYVEATKDADRLSLNLRFRPASTQLDNKALRDMDRIINMLAQPRLQGKSLLLLGFADADGSEALNRKLSKERAQLVAKEFTMRGFTAINVLGLGSVLPVASNENEAGREKNRRVEVWVK